MNKAEVNHHKAHGSRQWRTGAQLSRAGAPPVPRRGTGAAVAARGEPGARDGTAGASQATGCPCGNAFLPVRESLNWTLRRYVRALSLSVWLRRQAPEAACAAARAPVPAGRAALFRVAATRVAAVVAARTATAGETSAPAPAERVDGVSLSMDHALRYRIHRTRQMEHLAQVAASLRGGVRRGSAITPRERSAPWDLGLATLGSKTCVESNIFRFVMT
jgi:hypothetical protein